MKVWVLIKHPGGPNYLYVPKIYKILTFQYIPEHQLSSLTEPSTNKYSENSNSLSILLCAIGDPHNLGAILRSAYFLGVDNIFTTSCEFKNTNGDSFVKSNAPLTPVVSKASSGVLEIFQPLHVNDPKHFIEIKKSEGYTIIGSGLENNGNTETEQKSAENITDGKRAESGRARLLLIGNEGFGIPANLSILCDTWIHLKPGRQLDTDVDSLNVSVATALIINSIITPKGK